MESSHFVDDASQGPYVTFVVVILFVDLLGTHIVRGSYVSAREDWLIVHYAGKSKVSDLRFLIAAQEDIPRL